MTPAAPGGPWHKTAPARISESRIGGHGAQLAAVATRGGPLPAPVPVATRPHLPVTGHHWPAVPAGAAAWQCSRVWARAVLAAKPKPPGPSCGSCRRPADGLGLGGPELERSVPLAAARSRRHWHWQCAGGPAGTMPNDATCLKAACSLPGRPSRTLRKSRRVCLRLSARLKLANSDPEDFKFRVSAGGLPGQGCHRD